MKTLGIVTPSYNQAAFLERTIVSVLDQKDPNLRYAVVDGGSSDGSVEIIKKYEKYLSFWCSEPDRGQTHAVLKGFGQIGGDIRGWINSDDEYTPRAFARVRQMFASQPDLGLVYSDRVLIGPDSEVLGWTRQRPFNPEIAGFNIPSETAFWTAEAEEKAGSLDESLRFAMDLDFFVRLHRATPSRKSPAYFGMFRCHEDSKSSTIPEIGREEAAARWNAYYGDDMWAVLPERQGLKHALAGIRHPRLLAVPYLRHRFAQSLRSGRH